MTTLPQTTTTSPPETPYWKQPATILQVLLFALPPLLGLAWWLISIYFIQQAQAKTITETSTSVQRVQDAKESTASRLAVLEKEVSTMHEAVNTMGQDIKELLKRR